MANYEPSATAYLFTSKSIIQQVCYRKSDIAEATANANLCTHTEYTA